MSVEDADKVTEIIYQSNREFKECSIWISHELYSHTNTLSATIVGL